MFARNFLLMRKLLDSMSDDFFIAHDALSAELGFSNKIRQLPGQDPKAKGPEQLAVTADKADKAGKSTTETTTERETRPDGTIITRTHTVTTTYPVGPPQSVIPKESSERPELRA